MSKEKICQAHMAGQLDAGCKEPSWSNAHAYYQSLGKEEECAGHEFMGGPCCIHCGAVS